MKTKHNFFNLKNSFICFFIITSLFFALFSIVYSEKYAAYATDEEQTQSTLPSEDYVKRYTVSDYLYNAETDTLNTNYSIQDYNTLLWGIKSGNDDFITKIVPKQYFYTECEKTSVGKEYGFYIKTLQTRIYNSTTQKYNDGYMSDVFVFDISITLNSTGNEFYYNVMPLYIFNYYSDDNGVRPQTTYKPDLSDKYYLNNVSFGYTVFNENSYNSQDVYGYTKENDNGPVILQTRYNSNGYKGAEWQGSPESTYIAIKRIGGVLLKDTLKKIPFVEDAIEIIDLCLDIKEMSKMFVWEKTPITNNNELNIITYKGKNAYADDEPYLRTSVIIADDDIVYKSGMNHYAQGVLLLDSIEESYRIYEDIKLNIATVDEKGHVTVVSSGERQEYSVHNNSNRDIITEEDSQLVYTLPYGEKRLSFTPNYNGHYKINHNPTGNYTYYLYKTDDKRAEISDIEDIIVTKGTTYNLDIVSTDDSINAETFSIVLKSIDKDSSIPVLLNPKETIALKYQCSKNEILNIKSSDPNIQILNITNADNTADSLLNINQQSVNKKMYSANIYVIELVNVSNDKSYTANILLQDVPTLPSYSTFSDNEKFFSFTATTQAYYLISFSYANANIGVEILKDNLETKEFVQGFGPEYKTMNIFLNAEEKIYIGIYDSLSTSETVTINYTQESNSYRWKIGGKFIDGNSIEMQQGMSASLELIINDNISVKNFHIANADYKFETVNNTITINKNCRISNFFEVKPLLESTDVNGNITIGSGMKYYGSSLLITPILNDTYQIETFSDQSGYGLSWTNNNIKEISYVIKAGTNTKTITSNNGNIMSYIRSWNYKDIVDISIEIKSIKVQGLSQSQTVEDWVINNERGLSIPVKYVNALFGKGDGSEQNPFTINCVRHLQNINEASYYDNIDIKTYVGGNRFLLDSNITLSGSWTPIGAGTDGFTGTFDGNGHTIYGLYINATSAGYYGLFSISEGNISNLTLNQVSITATNNNSKQICAIGAVCGFSGSRITNVTVYGNLKGVGRVSVGGISGEGNGYIIENCTNYANISGGSALGGILGSGTVSIIKNCKSHQDIHYDDKYSDHDQIGGIAGFLEGGKITNCTFSACIYVDISDTNSRTLQPYIGSILGCAYENSSISGNNDTSCTINANNLNADVSWWEWFKTYHFNQKLYVKYGIGYTN